MCEKSIEGLFLNNDIDDLQMKLEQGIDDMEAKKERPIQETFEGITKLHILGRS